MPKRKDYFDIFCKLSKIFGTAATQSTLLNLIVESAVETMDGKAACLFLRDVGNEYFIPKSQIGLSETYMHASPRESAGIVNVLEKKGYIVFENAATDERLENHKAKKNEGIASILTVPVRVSNVTQGVLSLYTATRRKFDKSEIDFLCALADQGGIAVHTNNLINRLRNNAMFFLELASSINSSLDIQEILGSLTVNICDTLGMKGVTIGLLDEDTNSIQLVASHGLSDEFFEILGVINNETASRALKGETIIVSDTEADKRIEFKKEMKKEGIKSMIVTPILARDKVIGVMRLYSADYTGFPSDVLVMIEALAHQGGLAIQNASMYLKLKEEKINLEKDIWSHRAWF
ncbi:GAF domain-containing protein [Desulfobacula phenolica]|uniref:GAF domain-containing protein n=1 Tax=Desulfobacula phenolica TaxID=90732 RepID=A0A1H2DUS2_9BACT|nr:GAF domain-containing protein [Desulfobacula phenolica]SDT86615.1 GAF domain-containing protein [Desulfobacula phenolica]